VSSSLEIKKRIFLVGSARSGTTLLQSILSAHPEIFTFPETHFFSKTIPMRKSAQILWRIRRKDHSIILNYLKNIEGFEPKEKIDDLLPRKTISINKWVNGIIKLLDDIALHKHYSIWLEKTPYHLRYINLITRAKKDIDFVHIIRKGEDVIASLYDATHKYPEQWGGARSLENCVKRWKRDIKISLKFVGKKNHFFVLYDDLVDKPHETIKKLCNELEIKYVKTMLEDYINQVDKIVLAEEKWKSNVKKKIERRSKFDEVLSEVQKDYVRKEIEDINLAIFKS